MNINNKTFYPLFLEKLCIIVLTYYRGISFKVCKVKTIKRKSCHLFHTLRSKFNTSELYLRYYQYSIPGNRVIKSRNFLTFLRFNATINIV